MESENKLRFFKNAKNNFCVSRFLTKIKNRESRALISKLRLGVLPLEIEKGRRLKPKPARETRYCKLCNSGKIEDETHFLFECQSLSNVRTAHISALLGSLPTLENLDNTQRLNLLYFSEKTPTTTLNHAASMLVELFKYRDFLIDR